MTKLIITMQKFNSGLHNVLGWIVAFFIASMSILVVYQVFFRYVLNMPPGWTEEISLFTMVWQAFLVSPIAYRKNLFVSLDILLHRVKPKAFTIITFVFLILETVVLVVFLIYSYKFTKGGLASTATSLPFSMFYIYLCLPLGLFMMLLVAFEKFLLYFHCFATGRYQELAASVTTTITAKKDDTLDLFEDITEQ